MSQTRVPPVRPTMVGIAFYNQPNLRLPRWALVLHPRRYDSEHVRVYQICKRSNGEDWIVDHRICHLNALGDLIGVLHMTVSPYDLEILDTLLQTYPPGKEGSNPGQVFVWSPSAWVIRALSDLHENEYAIIPGKYRDRTAWEMATELCSMLRRMKPKAEKMRIISWPTN